MTIKKTNKRTGEVTEEQMSILGLLTGTGGFRVVITILILSMHPLGRGFLSGFGFRFPDEKLVTIAAEEAKGLRVDVDGLKKDVTELKENSSANKANNAIINSKLDRLEQTFSGFQIDFQKWKTKEPTQ